MTAKLNILHLYSDWRWTGPADPVIRLSEGLIHRGHKVTFALRPSPQPEGNNISSKLEQYQIPYTTQLNLNKYFNWQGIKDNIQDLCQLARYVNEQKFDIVHMHLSHDFALGMLTLPHQTQAKLIYTNHHGLPLTTNLFYKWAMNRLDQWVDIGQQLGQSNAETLHIPSHKHRIITSSTNTNDVQPKPKRNDLLEKYHINDHDIVIGIVSRLQRRRRFRPLLEALQTLSRTHPHFKFLFIGRGGRHQEELKQWIRELKIESHVIFTGYQTNDYLDTFNLLDVKIFLIPGFDGSCRAAMEAMALGKPLIVPHHGVLPELVHDQINGYVFSEINSHNIYQSLAKILDLPSQEREAMGVQSRHRILEYFSQDRECDAYEKLYRTLMDTTKPVF